MLNFLVLLSFSMLTARATINLKPIPSTNSPPISRLYHFMDYNSATDQLIIFGGSTNANLIYNDVWLFDISQSQYYRLDPTNEVAPGKI